MALLTNLIPISLKTFSSLLQDTPPAAALSDFNTIASYSWTEKAGAPVLVVPGAPPKWSEPRLPMNVAPDQGLRYIDHTGAQCARLGASRLMPLIQSVEICTPDFDYRKLDLICNRNNLRNLIRWIEGTYEKDFRIEIYLFNAGKTIVMVENAIECTEFVPRGGRSGFGDNFRARAVTNPKGQTRHNRIVTYQLGNLRVLMGHKVEACFGEGKGTTDDNLDGLVTLLNNVSISNKSVAPQTTTTTVATQAGPALISTRSGHSNLSTSQPQSVSTLPRDTRITVLKTKDVFQDYDFAEIKTLGQQNNVNWRRYHPQLYLSQTQHLFAARHSRGRFTRVERLQPDDAAWREQTINTEKSLGKLLEFIRRLLVEIKASGDGPWALVCTKNGLTLHKSMETLPQTIISLFDW